MSKRFFYLESYHLVSNLHSSIKTAFKKGLSFLYLQSASCDKLLISVLSCTPRIVTNRFILICMVSLKCNLNNSR